MRALRLGWQAVLAALFELTHYPRLTYLLRSQWWRAWVRIESGIPILWISPFRCYSAAMILNVLAVIENARTSALPGREAAAANDVRRAVRRQIIDSMNRLSCSVP